MIFLVLLSRGTSVVMKFQLPVTTNALHFMVVTSVLWNVERVETLKTMNDLLLLYLTGPVISTILKNP